MSHGPAEVSKSELRELGEHEAKEVDISLPLKRRIIKEVQDYNKDYGIASLADVVTEINSRGRDLEFQGELAVYATENESKIKSVLDQLVREGKIRRVRVPGAKVGYVVAKRPRPGRRVVVVRTRKTGRKYPVRAKSIWDGASDYLVDAGSDAAE